MTGEIEYGQKIIREFSSSLEALNLSSDFEFAVKTILSMNPQGRVVVTGMGKAGIIGTKISATLASVGVPSFFLHPAEAIHGDLGRFTKVDLALILSNSGETPEVLSLIPHLKRIPCPIISVTKDKDSTLGQHSDLVLAIGESKEAGPLALAPTTSTILMLAIGDALAMTLAYKKGISPQAFASYHPGGDLGRSLKKVKDIMRKNENLCICKETETAKEVLHAITITPGRPGAAVIVNENEKVSGIFTDGDLRRCLNSEPEFLKFPIKNFMGKNPKTVSDEMFAQDALSVLAEYKIDQVIVIDSDHKPIGLVDIQDLV